MRVGRRKSDGSGAISETRQTPGRVSCCRVEPLRRIEQGFRDPRLWSCSPGSGRADWLAAGHFRRSVAEVLLDVAFVDLGRRGQAGARRVSRKTPSYRSRSERSTRTPAARAKRLTRGATCRSWLVRLRPSEDARDMAVLAVEGQGPLGEIPGERREPGRDRGDGPWPAACARGAGSESREIAVSSARTSEGRSSCSATKTNTSRGATSPGCSTRPGNRRAQSWMAKPRRLCGRVPRDDGEVGRAECARPDQGGLGRRRSEQCFKLGLGDGATTRNGGSVPIGVMSAQSSGVPAEVRVSGPARRDAIGTEGCDLLPSVHC